MERIKFPHILIYNSSAGSGKTHQLALRYLHLLLNNDPDIKHHVNNILAVTFTNKSAQEMRKRILEWMKRILLDLNINDNLNIKITDEIKKEIVLNQQQMQIINLSTHEIQKRISYTFSYILKKYTDFKVSTIDSFVTLILKASAFKLGLNPDFEISLDIDSLLDNIVDRVFQDILDDKMVQSVFDDFINNYSFIRQERINWFPKDFIKENIKEIWKQIKQTGKNIVPSLKDSVLFDKKKEQIQKQIRGLLIDFSDQCQHEMDQGIQFKKFFDDRIQNFLIKKDINIFKGLIKNEIDYFIKKGSPTPSDDFLNTWQTIKKSLKEYYINQAFYYYHHLIDIYHVFEKKIETEVRHNQSIIMIHELNNLLKEILNKVHDDPDFLPELYYYLSARYYHFLIDEFQDTNFLQWQNIKILTDEGLSSGGSLFVVGDKKQGIYNWRGASSDLMDQLHMDFDSGYVYHNSLDINYRSDEQIIFFNNNVFQIDNIIETLLEPDKGFLDRNREKLINTYQQSFQKSLTTEKKGYVYAKQIIKKDLTVQQINEFIRAEFIKIITQIREREVYGDNEICILCRKNREVDNIVNWLLAEQINVESNTTVNILNNPLIQEIISLLTFLNDIDNNYAFTSFLLGDIFKKNFKENIDIKEWCHQNLIEKNTVLYREFQRTFPAFWAEYFDELFTCIGYIPVYEFVLLILKKWKILKVFNQFSPYFLKLLEIVKHIENQGDNGINRFLEIINENTQYEDIFLLNTGEGINAVKVMTIHQAKGLEYPVVIIPFVNLLSNNRNMFFKETDEYLNILRITKEDTLFSPELSDVYYNTKNQEFIEELNNLYVSFTRARNELYLLLPESKRSQNKIIKMIFNNNNLSDHIKDDYLEMGTLKDKADDYSFSERSDDMDMDYNFFPDDIKWFDLLKMKVIRPSLISRERILAQQKGEVIHYVFSLIHSYPDDQIDNKIEQTFIKFSINDEEIKHNLSHEIKQMLDNNFKNNVFIDFFNLKQDDQFYCEKDIVNAMGHLKRIDRLIIRLDKVEVIDYKTGEEHQKEHSHQVKEYMELVKPLFPEKEILGYLCYLDECKIREVK